VFNITSRLAAVIAVQTAAIAALSTTAPAIAITLGRPTSFTLQEATIFDIQSAFGANLLTSKELVQLYLNRIEAYDVYDKSGPQTKINSVLTLNPNALAVAEALDLERQQVGPRSLLHGVPIFLKDNIDTFDLPTTAGSVALAGSIPPNDAFIAQKLRDAGAVILGKTNLTEFANFLTNCNRLLLSAI